MVDNQSTPAHQPDILLGLFDLYIDGRCKTTTPIDPPNLAPTFSSILCFAPEKRGNDWMHRTTMMMMGMSYSVVQQRWRPSHLSLAKINCGVCKWATLFRIGCYWLLKGGTTTQRHAMPGNTDQGRILPPHPQ